MDILAGALYDYPVYALLAVSFYLSFRVLDFPDLAMDPSYAAGMALLVRVIDTGLFATPDLLALGAAVAMGFAIGSSLAFVHAYRHLRLGKLLAGLVISFGFYSVNFRLNLCTSTQGLYQKAHELNFLRDTFIESGLLGFRWASFGVGMLILVVAVTVVAALLRSRRGLCLWVAGHRPGLLAETGKSRLLYLIVGLGTAGAISSLAGCVRAATDNYADVNTFGTFLFALASLMLGERVLHAFNYCRQHSPSLSVQLAGPLAGALLMSLLVQFCIWLFANVWNVYLSSDIKLVIALAVLGSAARFGRRPVTEGMFDCV
jgi:putative ABC transport system permease protein